MLKESSKLKVNIYQTGVMHSDSLMNYKEIFII